MTTRNVRLSDDDIDRLIYWFGYKAGECMDVDEDHWLRDRLVEAKLSPSMDWPAWPEDAADRYGLTKPIQGVAHPRSIMVDDLPGPSPWDDLNPDGER